MDMTMDELAIIALATSVLVYAQEDEAGQYVVVPAAVVRGLRAAITHAYPDTAATVEQARANMAVADGWA